MIAVTDCAAWSELVAVPAQFVYRMPTGMSFQDGAALLMNYLTAYILLFDIGSLRKGQSVLVHSVGGGVVSPSYLCKYKVILIRKVNTFKLSWKYFKRMSSVSVSV